MEASEAVKTIKEAFTDYLKCGIDEVLQEALDNGWIAFEDDEQKAKLIDEIISSAFYHVELYHDGSFFDYHPNFSDLVFDTAFELGIWTA